MAVYDIAELTQVLARHSQGPKITPFPVNRTVTERFEEGKTRHSLCEVRTLHQVTSGVKHRNLDQCTTERRQRLVFHLY